MLIAASLPAALDPAATLRSRLTGFSGFLHALDAKTGTPYWTHDMLAAVWGSPMVINGNVYLGDEDGDVYGRRRKESSRGANA